MSPMINSERDHQIRLAAFAYLSSQRAVLGNDLPWSVLSGGFEFEGARVPLLGPQGIFIPAALREPIPLSITTAPPNSRRPRPYEDSYGPDGLLRYKYRGEDVQHRENIGLRLAMRDQVPLIYFEGIEKGWYLATYPVYVVQDDPNALAVTVAADEQITFGRPTNQVAENLAGARRAYVTQTTIRRLHQDKFRHNVLKAYETSCAVCELRRRELLEAAHILPDRDPRGVPEVFNGLSLCKLHHAAFDSNIIGIRPDHVVEVRSDVRREKDGPMLIHGIQECHNQKLRILPRREHLRPKAELLTERYELFRNSGVA